MGSQDPRSIHKQIRWLEFRNDSGLLVPAFALLEITGAFQGEFGRFVLTVQQPSGFAGGQHYAINGPTDVGILNASTGDGYGQCTVELPQMCLYNTAGTPAQGESWGPKSGQWTLEEGNPGFSILGFTDNTDFFATAIMPQPVLRMRATANGTITDGTTTGSVLLESNGAQMDNIDFTHATGSENISAGKDVVVQYFWDEGVWAIDGADCETP